jgi:hypothetical protein
MALEEIVKQDDDKKEEKDDKEEEDTKKSFDQTLIETISTLTEHVKAQSESLAALDDRLTKALEEEPKTQLDFPNTSDDEGVGEKVKVPDTYQSNSVQAELDADGAETEDDPEELVMQEKSEAPTENSPYTSIGKTNFDFTTETPRPTTSVETINKSDQNGLNMVLKDAREQGFDSLSVVAQKILKGDYYTPTQEESWF